MRPDPVLERPEPPDPVLSDPESTGGSIAIVGGGNLATNAVALLDRFGHRPVVCLDEFRSSALAGVPVKRVAELSSDDARNISRFVVAMSDPDHRAAATGRLARAGVAADRVLDLTDDPSLQTLRLLFERFGGRTARALNDDAALTVPALEAELLGDEWESTLRGLGAGSVVGLCCYGRGGGFSGHLAPLVSALSRDNQLLALTDEADGAAGLGRPLPTLTMSAETARHRKLVDVAVAAHVHPCTPPGVPRVTLSHTLHDLNLTTEYHASRWGMSEPHYLFAPTSAAVDAYLRTIATAGLTSPLCVVPGGYPHLDVAMGTAQRYSGPLDAIVYAPTLSISEVDGTAATSSIELGADLVQALLHEFGGLEVIVRPHPSDLRLHELAGSPPDTPLGRLLACAEGHPRCRIDASADYLPGYVRSVALVSDTSSTAMTFALATGRPAIFLSPRDEELVETIGADVDFLDDRQRIGRVAGSVEDLVAALRRHVDAGSPVWPTIERFRAERVFNLGRSADYLADHLDHIRDGDPHDDWIYVNG